MGTTSFMLWKVGLLLLALIEASSATLSPTGVNYEVEALVAIKSDLNDPHNVLENWDSNSVDPVAGGWLLVPPMAMYLLWDCLARACLVSYLLQLETSVTCNLCCFKIAISGPIPATMGIWRSFRHLISPIILSLAVKQQQPYRTLPESLSTVEGRTLVDLSFNNLSGTLPKISARTFKIVGNPLICGVKAENCSAVLPEPLSLPPDALKAQSDSRMKRRHMT
ncbi:protein NSP-INTERACTING KINASE 3 isoform X3 [Prunus yedoensis var. nudiflora]|uniref:Protein NSP-INTERACTING KINASE 3 isoform X3 n=1 Tax=Prunus yedoensis var. nudiflora TaxID=2094558 RepID=A0A314Z7J3_PRUYE|nr:protein NSP-INTERACTING KINASE 3 isoform X3 [Prunus yedoensis var. nudiflora]